MRLELTLMGPNGTVVPFGEEKHTRPAQFSRKAAGWPRKRSGKGVFRRWSGQRDSNSLPPPWHGGALPNELCPQAAPSQARHLFYHKTGICQGPIFSFLRGACRCYNDV